MVSVIRFRCPRYGRLGRFSEGYEEGRVRSTRFGLNYLRLNRTYYLVLVTIGPGFYQSSSNLNNPETQSKYQNVVVRNTFAQFNDVRLGFRIKDDVYSDFPDDISIIALLMPRLVFS